MAISNQDQLINDSSVNNRMQSIVVDKININSVARPRIMSLWPGNGIPVAGGSPTLGMAGAVTTDVSTTGALPLTAASGGRELRLMALELLSLGFEKVYLLDRLAHAQISTSQATASFSPIIDGTARLAAGEGADIILEQTVAQSAAANTLNFTYTNQAGTGSRTTKTFTLVASTPISASPLDSNVFVPLQDGDTGVRSIEGLTAVSGAATGQFNVILVRKIAELTLTTAGGLGRGKDYFLDLPSAPVINPNACLFLYGVRTATGACAFSGLVRILET